MWILGTKKKKASQSRYGGHVEELVKTKTSLVDEVVYQVPKMTTKVKILWPMSIEFRCAWLSHALLNMSVFFSEKKTPCPSVVRIFGDAVVYARKL